MITKEDCDEMVTIDVAEKYVDELIATGNNDRGLWATKLCLQWMRHNRTDLSGTAQYEQWKGRKYIPVKVNYKEARQKLELFK